MRRRGGHTAAPRSSLPLAPASNPSPCDGTGTDIAHFRSRHSPSHAPSIAVDQEWVSPSISDCETLILELVNISFEILFPIFPLFSKPKLLQRVASGEHLRNRAFYTAVTSLCALIIARVRDGAIGEARRDALPLEGRSSELFFAAATKALSTTAALTREPEYMQAYMLLSITSIQYGETVKARYFLNLYHNCVAVGLLHNEEEWPPGLSVDETEERRRLFWSAYTLDVFTSLIWKGPIHSSEAMFNVSYPSQDDLLYRSESLDPVRITKAKPSWLYGWNVITDLYRLLEYVLHRLRPTPQRPMTCFHTDDNLQATTTLLQQVTDMYNGLPSIFKSTRLPTNDVSEDLYSFQAANIAATVQLVRMVLFTIKRSSVEENARSPVSSPLLHHLAGIGILLGSTIYEKLSVSAYSHLRMVLLEFATLISNLENGMHYTVGKSHSEKLQAQLVTLDKYWTEQRAQSRAQSPGALEDPGPSSHQRFDTESPAFPYQADLDSISFPPELLEDWSSIFDFP
ncbi:hypothetical protein E2P81_ATG10370 [Venturia nashicola]|nr:hypothetical protein E2P81_ATG10370 [Venturia nashicola]